MKRLRRQITRACPATASTPLREYSRGRRGGEPVEGLLLGVAVLLFGVLRCRS